MAALEQRPCRGGTVDARWFDAMDPVEVAQFLKVLAVSFAALLAAPIVVLLAERPPHRERDERRERRRRWRPAFT